jgi:hypothetical protein
MEEVKSVGLTGRGLIRLAVSEVTAASKDERGMKREVL